MCNSFPIALPYAEWENQPLTSRHGADLTIPCGVTIGTVSRRTFFQVHWNRHDEDGSYLGALITYNSKHNTETILTDGPYTLNVTDFSLEVNNLSEDLALSCQITTHIEPGPGTTVVFAKTHVSLTECGK